ncbi:hypothetical protein HHK36_028074 [Tetracentron sinense]|uniref:DUF7651 domain-containing protein n=1 Tax=Tetracentron sinense TaxID=13715 RepID=A0A834YE83_TETSI|nr:hypothetical protein HHK36_028074 [Tetracentron sinense]
MAMAQVLLASYSRLWHRNPGYNCSNSRTSDQMCRQDSRVHLSAQEAIAAEESLSIYCKPVELYNILQRRAVRNVMLNISFPQRKTHTKMEYYLEGLVSEYSYTRYLSLSSCRMVDFRIQMTISLSGTMSDVVQAQNLLPLYIMLARPASDIAIAGVQQFYRLSRACVLTASTEFEGRTRAEAKFILPEISKLVADIKAGKLTILLVSHGETKDSLCESDLLKDHCMTSFPCKIRLVAKFIGIWVSLSITS